MKQTFAIIVLMLASIFCFAQTKAKTVQLPPSFYNQASEEVDHIQVYPPSAQLIAEDIAESDKNGTFYKVARLVPVNTTVKNSGSWETLGNGMLIWRLRLSSEGARASALYFDKFDIPSGASVYVYSSDRKIVDGPYYRSDNPDGTEYMIGNILGSDITIEYVAPMMKSGNGNVSYDNTAPIINIGEFGYVYRGEGGFETGQRGPFGDSESCEVNINCSVGADWRIQQRGVARIYVVEGYSAGYCTGTLVNNTSNDGTPYFLTADHCGPSATTSNFNQWKFRFNYEASGCSNPSSESSINYTDFTGCTKVAEGSNNGGSDFYLLRLNNFTTQNAISVNAIYNGWDRSTTAPSGGGAGIHHPAGDIKKISFFSSTPTTATYNGGSDMTGANNAHWKITWVNSGEKTGVTEGGSSGSPIFNSAGRVFGTLSGGASSCSASSSSRYDLYGKMSFHWDNSANGSTNAYKLKPWLDPNNTGATTCDYYDPANTNALTVSPNAVTLPSGGGSQTVSVRAGTSSANWTATSSASWLTVSPTSGSGLQATTSVTLTASANTGSSRTATVTFSHGGTTATVTVTQSDESDQCLIYNEDIMEDDSTATTGIGSNLYFSSYFKVIAEKVNVTGNYTLDKITFADMLNTATSGSIAIKVLSATNAGAPSTTELYSATVNVSTINNALTQGQLQGGGTCYYGEYEHTLNSPINVTGPFFISVDFTNVGAGNSSTMSNIVCIADNQNNGLDNTAYINSIYSGYTGWYLISNFFNGVDEAKFAIQAHICPSSTPATTLTVSPSSLTYIAAGETKTVTVTSNTSWTATSSASWLTISPASGSNNGTITAVAAANTSTSQRTATITVSGTGVSSQTISVTQAGDNGGETGDCVVLHEDRFTDSPSLYSVEDGGYVCGSNSYGDQAKAELFDLSGNYNLTSIDYLYAIDGSSGSVTFKVWANSNGTPGSELATKTVTMSELYNAGTSTGSGTTKQGLYTWTLTSPVAVSSNFFAGIDVS
ncbi:MAG: BACON domain-containing protein, partial [Bacteroidales bacterium]|nr:BACON domain-containing protein [Bacteroidales bacterium]